LHLSAAATAAQHNPRCLQQEQSCMGAGAAAGSRCTTWCMCGAEAGACQHNQLLFACRMVVALSPSAVGGSRLRIAYRC
jgi:hypothetical protein